MKNCIMLGFFGFAFCTFAQEGWDPIPRRIPPKGIEVAPAELEALKQRSIQLAQRLSRHTGDLGEAGERARETAPDVLVFLQAVEWAVKHGEFYHQDDVKKARWALDEAEKRLDHFEERPWEQQTGLVVRGYRSSIDRSAQPYGVEIPADADPAKTFVFLHGRGDKTTDLHFMHQRAHKVGKVAPANAMVIHPFGRHCMGFKSAGEIDVLEVVEHAAQAYGTSRRPVLMGFSMGGAGVWHIGAHYPDRWSAIAPGAGFAETRRYIKLKDADYPPAYEQSLWGIYDVPNYVRNLFNRPVFAYSGEIDKQKQAADVMAEAFVAEGRALTHLIGPKTAHKYHPETLNTLLEHLEKAHAADQIPDEVHLQTQTLRYHRVFWVEATGLNAHWQDSRIDAKFSKGVITATTRNIRSLKFHRSHRSLVIDGQKLEARAGAEFSLVNDKGKWIYLREAPRLRKKHGLQGPIDDAFMGQFLVLDAVGRAAHPAIQKWLGFERQHFETRWNALYRGRVWAGSHDDSHHGQHLVLWGTPKNNPTLKRVADTLPIRWGDKSIQVGEQTFDSRHHVLMMIYPNPLDPDHYLVINSGPTHREGHDRTNSLQNPKLPDWAVIDVREPPNATAPGKVVAAGFFDENWQLKP